MNIQTITMGPMDNNCYILTDEATGEVAVVDPSFKVSALTDAVEPIKDKIKYILLTHRHYDHLLGTAYLKELTGAQVAIHRLDAEGLIDSGASRSLASGLAEDAQQPVKPDILLDDGDYLNLGESTIKVMHTPGHTVGGATYIAGDALFTGDTLFRSDIGRMDLPTGSYREMSESLMQLAALPGDYKVYPGHGEPTAFYYDREHNRYRGKTDYDAFNS